MLIEHYDLQVLTPPCDPGAERFTAKARLVTDIREVLPYLNATLRGAVYLPDAHALTWKKGGHNIAFHAYEIATSNVEDRAAATKEIEGLVKLVYDEESDNVLGVHILGPGSEDLIQIAAAAMRGGLKRREVGAMHYVFPTLGGAVFDAMAGW